MYNFLTVNIMDKISCVRSFQIKETIRTVDLPEGKKWDKVVPYLHMYSTYQGEYGSVTLSVAAQLADELQMQSRFLSTSAESSQTLFDFRQQEVLFFLGILSLFNPQNNKLYEKVSPSQESSEF